MILTILVVDGVSSGLISKRTRVSFGPLMSSTILDSFISTTSTNSPSACATLTIWSFGFNSRDDSAGPPGKSSLIVQYPSLSVKTAPIPTSSLFIAWSNFSFSLMFINVVWGSNIWVRVVK